MIGKNAVIPYVIVLLYGVFIALSVFLLSEMTELTDLLPNILTTSAMVSFPVVTRQYAYLYRALSYALSFFMVTFAAMPVWPVKGSVDWVGDVVVVKMTDSPPFY